jgi:hypothetical protein
VRVGVLDQVLLGPNWAIAEQAPSNILFNAAFPVLKHFLKVLRELDTDQLFLNATSVAHDGMFVAG